MGKLKHICLYFKNISLLSLLVRFVAVIVCLPFEIGSHYLTLSVLELVNVDQFGLVFAEMYLPLPPEY